MHGKYVEYLHKNGM